MLRAIASGLLATLLLYVAAPPAEASFTLFESGPVRPLALSPDGTRLFVVNIPDARLEIFRVGAGELEHQGSVGVGLDPVAVAARNPNEVWVVNHLSDSVSVVDVESDPPRVTRTLLVQHRRAQRGTLLRTGDPCGPQRAWSPARSPHHGHRSDKRSGDVAPSQLTHRL